MIETIARRVGGFTSTTAVRWLGAARDSVREVELPPAKEPSLVQKLHRPLVTAAVSGAVAVVSSNKTIRRGLERGLRSVADRFRPEDRPSGGTASTKVAPGGNRSSNGNGGGDISAKTRSELYEMAKEKNIPGRSSMSREELAKALTK